MIDKHNPEYRSSKVLDICDLFLLLLLQRNLYIVGKSASFVLFEFQLQPKIYQVSNRSGNLDKEIVDNQ